MNAKKLHLFLLQLIKKEVVVELVFFYTIQLAEGELYEQHVSPTALCGVNSSSSQGSSQKSEHFLVSCC